MEDLSIRWWLAILLAVVLSVASLLLLLEARLLILTIPSHQLSLLLCLLLWSWSSRRKIYSNESRGTGQAGYCWLIFEDSIAWQGFLRLFSSKSIFLHQKSISCSSRFFWEDYYWAPRLSLLDALSKHSWHMLALPFRSNHQVLSLKCQQARWLLEFGISYAWQVWTSVF